MQEIDVDKIMKEIREGIKEKGMETQKLEFADVNMQTGFLELPEKYDKDMMYMELVKLNGVWDTSLEELQSNHPIKNAVKKVIQKAVCMVVSPHVAKQVVFNISVVASLNMLNSLAKENEKLREEIEILKKEVRQLREGKE